mmetsp:Transcript_6598/g.19475  ORF Transcript_6598/g.19475 Transcript_6598/m.19475 type:complete len:97 (-) Transcript_6598:449-739(-)
MHRSALSLSFPFLTSPKSESLSLHLDQIPIIEVSNRRPTVICHLPPNPLEDAMPAPTVGGMIQAPCQYAVLLHPQPGVRSVEVSNVTSKMPCCEFR